MDRLFTTKELATYFNVTEMTIYRWRKQGMPFKKLGYNMYRYSMHAVNAWLDEKQSVAK